MDTATTAQNCLKRSGRSNASSTAPCKVKDTKMKPNKKGSYRHIPHSEKPPHLVARRNERERRRVQAVNSAFLRLRKYVPHEPRNKRLSKFKTLKFAIQYIHLMQDMIQSHDCQLAFKQQNLTSQIRQRTTQTRLDILSSPSSSSSPSSQNQRIHETVKSGGPSLRELSSTFISVLNPVHSRHGESANETLRFEPSYSENVTGQRSTHYERQFSDECGHRMQVESIVCPFRQQYNSQYNNYNNNNNKDNNNNNNSSTSPSSLSYHSNIRDSPFSCQGISIPLNAFGHALNSSSSPPSSECQIPRHHQGQDLARQPPQPQPQQQPQQHATNHYHYSDCSYQPQTPSTSSSHGESWEDCSSDASLSTSQDVQLTPPLELIPPFHQVISFLDTENYNDTNNITCSGNVVMRNQMQTKPLYNRDMPGFSFSRPSSSLLYPKTCLTG